MTEITCNQYNSSCTLSVETCAKRYQKATFNPDDMSLDPCRKCPDGKKNFDVWKDSFENEGGKKRFVDMSVVTKKQYKCRFCGTPTASSISICLKCQIEGRTPEEKDEGGKKATGNRHEERGDKKDNRKDSGQAGMTNSAEGVMGTKVCLKCGTPASSNVQPTCKKCGEPFEKKEKKTGTPAGKKANKLKSQASLECDPRQSKAAIVQQGNIGPEGGRGSESETYTITVDFSRFPKLHERLVNMADEEIRVPGDQLLFMLKNTLETMEERV